jgi:lipoprotein-anchoring transpeptidase ErfK/SrfK
VAIEQGASRTAADAQGGRDVRGDLGRAVDVTGGVGAAGGGTRPAPVDVTGGVAQGNNPSTTPGSTPGSAPSATPGTAPSSTPGSAPSATPGTTPGNTPGGTPSASPSGVPGAGGAAPAGTLTPTASTSAVQSLVSEGDRLVASGKLVEARAVYSRALLHPEAASADKAALRTKLTTINDDLVFSTKVTPGDPLVESYKVVSGDSLVRIRRNQELAVDWRFIQRVNRMANPNALKVGQTLKLVRGPFHAVVNKSEYRMDVFTGAPDEPDRWIYIRSYRVGLGEGNSTPVGTYTVKRNSKLVNPHWVNPRTGEKFDANDPKNPIGEYWIGWQGVGASAVNTGYGIHGTIEPDSIGQQRSMGCVRLGSEDVAQVYEMLVEEVSVVKVLP